MSGKTMKRIVAVTLLISVLFSFAGCGGKVTRHNWDGHQFTTKYTSVNVGNKDKRIEITLNFGDEGVEQDFLEEKMENGMITLNGELPSMIYRYGETKDGKVAIAAITFTMPLEYSYNESDLVVVE